jgi:hypothetical protein
MSDDHAKTMTNICRFAPTCSRPFGRTDCSRAWCFGSAKARRPGHAADSPVVPPSRPDDRREG